MWHSSRACAELAAEAGGKGKQLLGAQRGPAGSGGQDSSHAAREVGWD